MEVSCESLPPEYFASTMIEGHCGGELISADQPMRNHVFQTALSENRATLGGQCHEAFGELDDFSR